MSEFYRLLSGVISVPVYNTEVDQDSTAKQYVVIMPSFDEKGGTKNSFHGSYYINLDVSDIVPDNAQSWEAVSDLSNEILDIICPTPKMNEMSSNSDFAILTCRCVRSRNMPILRTGSELIMRKILEFEILISQK